ncbi:3-oxoacyl-ACP reductase [Salinisphaera sp. PC39]|uniref:3-oxoacyl-ACP reductase FabG n=1 Tax=Salinisphaera sp. PC39 TaxID=1304156 RepID=UPI00333EC7F4
MQELEGQIALVTGATRGIGAAIARTLGEAGATVIGTATSDNGADRISETLKEAGAAGAGRVLDVADPAQPAELVKAVTAEFGAPTILVNNAAVTRDNLVLRMKDEEWQAVMDTNLAGVYRMCKAVLRGMMKARDGRIVSIASVVGQMGNAGQVNYAAAKAGLFGLTKSLAREVASRGITVNAVAPGFIDTDMTRDLPAENREALLAQIPLERLGQADDVAAAVRFLASPQAGYITGETINVNGGLHMI